ncbi:proteasome maturation protein [Pectinophora gossypiella]|uniref:proteasome maturation protein n=1 Tax=Pectinophora gossypiella TaxID=13191 RepID=UPI00214F614D|nr:proteasome maturation protein [Pectinophora gossypiella]
MSFGLPSVKVKPEHEANFKMPQGTFGVPNPFIAGLGAERPKLGQSHPLEYSERNYHMNEEKMNMAMLRNMQGLHAPLKLTMEKKFCSKVGHLPFLPSSNFQMDVITGRNLDVGFEDILNTPDFSEVAGQPHAVMERSLGLL